MFVAIKFIIFNDSDPQIAQDFIVPSNRIHPTGAARLEFGTEISSASRGFQSSHVITRDKRLFLSYALSANTIVFRRQRFRCTVAPYCLYRRRFEALRTRTFHPVACQQRTNKCYDRGKTHSCVSTLRAVGEENRAESCPEKGALW